MAKIASKPARNELPPELRPADQATQEAETQTPTAPAPESKEPVAEKPVQPQKLAEEAPQKSQKLSAKVTVVTVYPYPLIVPRQNIRLLPGVPTELDDSPWVQAQLAGKTLRLVE